MSTQFLQLILRQRKHIRPYVFTRSQRAATGKSGLKLVFNVNIVRKPQIWELSRLCPEASTKLYVHEFGFGTALHFSVFNDVEQYFPITAQSFLQIGKQLVCIVHFPNRWNLYRILGDIFLLKNSFIIEHVSWICNWFHARVIYIVVFYILSRLVPFLHEAHCHFCFWRSAFVNFLYISGNWSTFKWIFMTT